MSEYSESAYRCLFRGAWHGSSLEYSWSVRFTWAGATYIVHPQIAFDLFCRPDFKLRNGLFADAKPNVSTWNGGRYPTGNIAKLINASRATNASMAFLGSLPNKFDDYDDFVQQIMAEEMSTVDELGGFHVFSLYVGGEKRPGTYFPMFRPNGDVEIVNTDCSVRTLKDRGFDVSRTMDIYREYVTRNDCDSVVYGGRDSQEMLDALNKQVFMKRDEDLMWKPAQNDYDDYDGKHLDDGCLDWDGKIY